MTFDEWWQATQYNRLFKHLPTSKDYAQAAWQAALATAIPEGFVLVPKEPTKEMLHMITPAAAAYSEWIVNYKAMLAAAPKPGGEGND